MFEVLTAYGEQARRWDAFVEMLPYDLRDLHFTSAWGRANEAEGVTARLAVLSDNGHVALQPFLLRQMDGHTDMTAAGYGGMVTSHALPGREDGAAFEREMSAWRTANRVVSEFALINPIYAGHQMVLAVGAGATLTPVKDVAILHLGSDEEILKGMRATRRHALGKAAVATAKTIPWAAFADLYASAMGRKNAAARWRLDGSYFEGLEKGDVDVAMVGALPYLSAAHAEAAAVFLFGKSVAYYHLAATVAAPPPGAADAVVMAGARLARDRGCDWLHLGGGVTAAKEDSLLAYKRSFGGVTRVAYSVRRVFNRAAYNDLCAAAGTDPFAEFFPAYRAKEAA